IQPVLGRPDLLAKKIERIWNERSSDVEHVTTATVISHYIDDQPVCVSLQKINLIPQLSEGRARRRKIRNSQITDGQTIRYIRPGEMKICCNATQTLNKVTRQPGGKYRPI